MFLTTQLHEDKFTASHCDLIFVHGIHPIGGYFGPNIRLYNCNLFINLQLPGPGHIRAEGRLCCQPDNRILFYEIKRTACECWAPLDRDCGMKTEININYINIFSP